MISTRLWGYFLLLLVCIACVVRNGDATCPPAPIHCSKGTSGDQRWGKRSFMQQIRNAAASRTTDDSPWNLDDQEPRFQLSELLRRLQEQSRH